MFSFLSKNNKVSLVSPSNGELIPMEKVNDPVFSQKALGDGYAINPSNDNIYSPLSGKISSIFPTKHAIGIITDEGLEVLLHLGINTVELNGKPFNIEKSVGDHVFSGDLIMTMNRAKIVDSGKIPTVIVIFTDMSQVKELKVIDKSLVEHGEIVATVTLNK